MTLDVCQVDFLSRQTLLMHARYADDVPTHVNLIRSCKLMWPLIRLPGLQHIEVQQGNGDFVREISVSKVTMTRAYPIAPDQQRIGFFKSRNIVL